MSLRWISSISSSQRPACWKLSCCRGTCLLLVGGEKLEPHLAQKALAVFTALVNVYGPTETCIWSTGKHYRRAATDRVLTIGRPLPGERCLVLAGRPLPVGAIGELYIGGSGVAEGYHNQPELTASRFVSLSFAEGIWYRGGARAFCQIVK